MKGTKLKGFYSVVELSEKLGITPQGIKYLIEKDELAPVNHIDRKYLIPESTVEAFLKSRKGIQDNRYKI